MGLCQVAGTPTLLVASAFLNYALTRNHGRPTEQCVTDAAAGHKCMPTSLTTDTKGTEPSSLCRQDSIPGKEDSVAPRASG